MENWVLGNLPLEVNVLSAPIVNKLVAATRALAELKGIASKIPNEQILISTLVLREAGESSGIENIVTTHDELYQFAVGGEQEPAAVKEVKRYAKALQTGFDLVRNKGVITLSMINQIQEELLLNNAGLRKLPGTSLKNSVTGEEIYVPPQHPDKIKELMENLIAYINTDELDELDPLIKMAIIHHQFESIHPYYDGNGRAGRILNMLYLVNKGLLNLPILYLSQYILTNRAAYYKTLQKVRLENDWESYLMYMLTGVEQTALETIETIKQIAELMKSVKTKIRSEVPVIYSQELINNIFKHPYTKIELIMKDLDKSRATASKYLSDLERIDVLTVNKVGRHKYYLNHGLIKILS